MYLEVIELELNGNLMPAPIRNGVEITKEPIWSKNTGRNGKTVMVGTILSEKRTVSIKWPPLREDQVARIEENLSAPGKPWISIKLTMDDASVIEFTGYSGPAKSTSWDMVGGRWCRTGMKVTVIER